MRKKKPKKIEISTVKIIQSNEIGNDDVLMEEIVKKDLCMEGYLSRGLHDENGQPWRYLREKDQIHLG